MSVAALQAASATGASLESWPPEHRLLLGIIGRFRRRAQDRALGSLAGVIVLILWLYISSIAVLIGGELNAELERRREKRNP